MATFHFKKPDEAIYEKCWLCRERFDAGSLAYYKNTFHLLCDCCMEKVNKSEELQDDIYSDEN